MVLAEKTQFFFGLTWLEGFEELQDAETVDTLVAGVDEELAAFEVFAQWSPDICGSQLLAQKLAHGCLHVMLIKEREHFVSLAHGIEGLVGVEGIGGVKMV